MIPENPFGRPEDKDIEREFMKKIRGDKLQAINAQCQLEICLAFKYGKKQKATKSRRSRSNKEEQQDSQSMQQQVKMILISNFDFDRREKLAVMFKQIKDKWKFEEIQENQPLPDYFFDDECDLSYILYELQKTEEPEFQKFTAQDLLFLEFLCLEGRKHLNETIIKYYLQNMNFMIEAMKNGLAKIQEKLQILKHKSGPKSKDRKISNEEAQSQFQSLDLVELSDNQRAQEEEGEEKQRKTKKIKKQKKDKKSKKGKKDEDSQQDQDEEQNGSEQNNYPTDKELALKTCNYIAWAYWYIIKKQ